jgi:hypothetical protein
MSADSDHVQMWQRFLRGFALGGVVVAVIAVGVISLIIHNS